jgi:hypothetical protein
MLRHCPIVSPFRLASSPHVIGVRPRLTIVLGILCSVACGSAHAFVITSGPVLRETADTKAVVVWESAAAGVGHVRYGTSAKVETRTADHGPATRHEVTLTGLRPGQQYFYAVYEGEVPRSDVFSFRTRGASFATDGAIEVRRIDYGGSIALADGVVLLGTLVGGLLTQSEDVAAAVSMGYLVAAPIVHLSHRNHGRALESLALRAGLLVLGVGAGAMGGSAADCGPRSFGGCAIFGAIFGGVVGIVSASAIDINLLAQTEEQVGSQSTVTEHQTLTLAPGLGRTEQGSMTFGLQGRF